MVVTEGTDLLPVSQYSGINAVPVHVTSYCMTVTADSYTGNERSVCFVTVVDLYAAGKHQESGAEVILITSGENGIVRGNIGQNVEARIRVYLAGIAFINACDLVHRQQTCTCCLEVYHRVKAALGVVTVLVAAVIPTFTCHPEIVRPVSTGAAGVILSPLFKSSQTSLLQLVPGTKLNVFSGIAAETVNAVGLDPLSKPCGDIAGYGIGGTVLAHLFAESTLVLPFCLEELRNTNRLLRFCFEVRKTGQALYLFGRTIALFGVTRQT